MLGTTMAVPMLTSRLIDHACSHHGAAPVIGRETNGSIRRESWSGVGAAARRRASAMTGLGYGKRDVVGTLAWNTLDHLTVLYRSIGIGTAVRILHPRLAVDDLTYMTDSVWQKTIFSDSATCEKAERLAREASGVTRWIYMGDGEAPDCPIYRKCVSCSQTIRNSTPCRSSTRTSPRRSASHLGRPGQPKGVAYSHHGVTLGAINMSMA